MIVITYDREKISPDDIRHLCAKITELTNDQVLILPDYLTYSKIEDKETLVKYKEQLNKLIDYALEEMEAK